MFGMLLVRTRVSTIIAVNVSLIPFSGFLSFESLMRLLTSGLQDSDCSLAFMFGIVLVCTRVTATTTVYISLISFLRSHVFRIWKVLTNFQIL